MSDQETSKNKIQKICDVLTKETIAPAEKEAKRILDKAKKDAEQIIDRANKEAEAIREKLAKDLSVEKESFLSTLELATRQVASDFRQKLTSQLFVKELKKSLRAEMSTQEHVQRLLQVICEALEKEGIRTNFWTYIPKNVDLRDLASSLALKTLEEHKNQVVPVEGLKGGVQVKIEEGGFTLDLSDKALLDILLDYIPRDIREKIFQNI